MLMEESVLISLLFAATSLSIRGFGKCASSNEYNNVKYLYNIPPNFTTGTIDINSFTWLFFVLFANTLAFRS